MKTKFKILTAACLVLLFFNLAYILTRLICKGMYVDAMFVAAIAVLFPLMSYFNKKGK